MNFGMDYQGDMGGGYGGGGGSGNKGGFSGGNSQQQQQRARKSYDDQTLIPITARMALAAQSSPNMEGSLQLPDGRELHMVKLVGAIRSFEDFSTNVLYQIEDGTGLMDVKLWLDDNECSVATEMRQSTLKEHIYVKVVGQIKDYDGNKQIIASSVRPLATSNELTHHLLEVVYSGERAKIRDSIVPPTTPTSSSMGGMGMGMGSSGFGMGQHHPLSAQSGFGGGGFSNNSELKEAVIKFIRTEGSRDEVGANVNQCIRVLSSRFPVGNIRGTFEELAAEGIIYSTTSEDNFKFAM